MSSFLEIILEEELPGLVERRVSWGSEEISCSPKQFEFDHIGLTLYPIAEHVRATLPTKLAGMERCLEVDQSVLLEWEGCRLSQGLRASLQKLLAAVSAQRQWAVVYESGRGSGIQRMHVVSGSLFSYVDRAVRGENGNELTTISS